VQNFIEKLKSFLKKHLTNVWRRAIIKTVKHGTDRQRAIDAIQNQKNEKGEITMKIELSRTTICSLMIAATCIKHDSMAEMNDPTTTTDRKNILRGTIKKWQEIHDELKAQLDKQDAQNQE